jgi:hypothetical protein
MTLYWALAIAVLAIIILSLVVGYRAAARSREAKLADATTAHEVGSKTLPGDARDHQQGYGYPHQ